MVYTITFPGTQPYLRVKRFHGDVQ